MIEWKKYDPTSREIESHINHLVTDGHRVLIAQLASVVGAVKYSWMINNSWINWVTHYAQINLPAKCIFCKKGLVGEEHERDEEGNAICRPCFLSESDIGE
ncbi:hypothetical protein BBD42_13020 [Paenibacillus sp. BIHB 4019]|uniref:Uncharacterized protein n=1 Tax=Paenibacillus sp. BIHB 4019 TaxID=1870819 RepID=A0A1B2DHU8_9BACL|nr:hypothetical protein [Paenibacillus sp. BIHB 4019]ANY67292.1 hypothetical protein BBD42_13020 [Paenibacillus sp. BIHB 4019]